MACKLRVMPCSVFSKSNPTLIGVEVIEGSLNKGASLHLFTPDETRIDVGTVSRMQANHADVTTAQKGGVVVVEVQSTANVSLDGKVLYATPGAT